MRNEYIGILVMFLLFRPIISMFGMFCSLLTTKLFICWCFCEMSDLLIRYLFSMTRPILAADMMSGVPASSRDSMDLT